MEHVLEVSFTLVECLQLNRHTSFRVQLNYTFRDVPTFGLYMLTYEHVLCLFKKVEDRSPHTSITSQLVAGGIAGANPN